MSADPELRQFLEGLPPRYLRIHSEAEIAGPPAPGRAKAEHKGAAVSLTRSTAWVLTVVAGDRPFLFASIAAALSSFGFNILKAEAFTNAHGKVIDTFTFADTARNLELNPGRDARRDRDGNPRHARRRVGRRVAAAASQSEAGSRMRWPASRVNFDNTASPTATLIEMTTQDRPGLLYDVAAIISKQGAQHRGGAGRYRGEEGDRRFLRHQGAAPS